HRRPQAGGFTMTTARVNGTDIVPAVVTPDYWDDACRHLARRDRVMRKLIPQCGEGQLQSRGDAFTTLARSIVGQQISVKAAQSGWDPFAALGEAAPRDRGGDHFAALLEGAPGRIRASAVLETDVPGMRAAGLSGRKVEYLLD